MIMTVDTLTRVAYPLVIFGKILGSVVACGLPFLSNWDYKNHGVRSWGA